MSVENIQIDGVGNFNDSTENAGVVSYANFADTAVNSGTISVSAEFSLSAANHGIVTQVAVFNGDAVNTGTVAIAQFKDNAVNAGTVSTSAVFADSASNTGTTAAAEFKDTAKNDGGTVTGNASFANTAENIGTVGGNATFTDSAQNKGGIAGDAVFADTTVNTGTVSGNAEVADTADNSGGIVNGSVSEYVPPSNNPAAGTVLSAGLVAYATIEGNQVDVGTYDAIADGNGGSTNGNYSYTAAGTYLLGGSWYTLNGSGGGSYATGTLQASNGNWYTFDSNGGGIALDGTYILSNGGSWSVVSEGVVLSSVSTGIYYLLPSPFFNDGSYNNKWLNLTTGNYPSGTLQAGNGKWYTFDGVGGGSYAAAGTLQIASDSNKWYTFDGNGGGEYTPVSIVGQYRYDGIGGRIEVYSFNDINNVTYYASSATLALGVVMYNSDGTIHNGQSTITIGDIEYSIENDGSGEIYSIVDTDPYN